MQYYISGSSSLSPICVSGTRLPQAYHCYAVLHLGKQFL